MGLIIFQFAAFFVMQNKTTYPAVFYAANYAGLNMALKTFFIPESYLCATTIFWFPKVGFYFRLQLRRIKIL